MPTGSPPILATPEAPICRVCGTAVAPAVALGCVHCRAPHHADCWAFQGGCAIYGCGCEEVRPFPTLPPLDLPGLTATGDLPAPARLAATLEAVRGGLVRRLRARSRDLPWTLREGLFAASLTSLVYLGLEGVEGAVAAPLQGFFLLGVAHGLLAPALAPLQHRHPAALGSLAAGLFLLTFPPRMVTLPLIRTTLQVLAVTLASTGMAELAAGDSTSLGERLGAAALPTRYALTFLAAGTLWLVAFLVTHPGWALASRELQFFAILALLSAAVAAPALERGRREFRRKLLAAAPES